MQRRMVVILPTFRDNLSSPSSRVKPYKKNSVFLVSSSFHTFSFSPLFTASPQVLFVHFCTSSSSSFPSFILSLLFYKTLCQKKGTRRQRMQATASSHLTHKCIYHHRVKYLLLCELVKKFPAFPATRSFIPVSTTAGILFVRSEVPNLCSAEP